MENVDEIQKYRKDLFHDLRAELGHLKGCQTSLLIFSSAGAGLFLSLLRHDTYLHPAYLFLLPLMFLLPLWIIFYEKARSVARIVGFIRVQEVLFDCCYERACIGWESAMKKYWQMREIWDDRRLDGEFLLDNQRSATTSVYWFAVFLTFFIFTSLCLIGGLVFLPIQINVKIEIVLALVCTFVMSFRLLQLHKIGQKKNKTIYINENTGSFPHTNMKTFAKKAIRLVFSFNGFFWIFFVIGVLGSFLASPTFYIEKSWFSQVISLGVPLIIYIFFISSAIFSASLASWMFLNLVKSRYSYDLFEVRWQIILDIKIDRNTRTVEKVNWGERIVELQNAIDTPSDDAPVRTGASAV